MAIRKILNDSDPFSTTLHKKCRPVTDFNKKLWDLLDDMIETLHDADGVGLAGPQVGILRRVFIVDLGEGVIEFVNPTILETEGSQEGSEGCLSFPGEWGLVERPNHVKIEAQDRNGKTFVMEGDELLARALLHESDHLDGVVFKERASRMLSEDEL